MASAMSSTPNLTMTSSALIGLGGQDSGFLKAFELCHFMSLGASGGFRDRDRRLLSLAQILALWGPEMSLIKPMRIETKGFAQQPRPFSSCVPPD